MEVSYGHQQIPKRLLYQTAIKAIGEAAEAGLDNVVKTMFTKGLQGTSWKLLPARPGPHEPPLLAGYSRVAAKRTLNKMIADDKWMSIYVSVTVDGRITAVGGFE